jgi:predicted exporter
LSRKNVAALLWSLVVCALVAHNLYLWLDHRIAPESDILALLPAEARDPARELAFARMVDQAEQRVIVLVGAGDWGDAARAADAYKAVVARRPDLLQSADAAVTQTNDWLEPFRNHRLGLLTRRQAEELRRETREHWIEAALARLYSPFGGPKAGAWQDDPFGLFAGWLQARAEDTPVRPRDGRLYVGDGARHYEVMPLKLGAPAFSMDAQDAVMPLLAEAREAARRAVPGAEVATAGVILHAAAAGAQARWEISVIGIGSTAGVAILMWLAFRSLAPIAWVMLSLVVGCLGALSVSWLVFERLHVLTLVFGASLIGVAEDYGIHFLCNRAAADADLDSWRLMRRLLPTLFLTMLTTVIGYLALALTPFPGLRQMAVFSAVGLLFAWLTVVFWFPVLVRSGTQRSGPVTRWYVGALSRWPSFGLDRSTLVAALAFAAFAAFGFSRLGVQDDIRLLQNPPKNLLDDQMKVSRLLDAPAPAQFYLVRGATPEAVLEREETLTERLDPLIERRVVSGYHALSSWTPSSPAQAAHRALVDEKLLGPDGALPALAAALGEDRRWAAALRDRLLAASAPLAPEDFLKTPAGEPWRHLWLGKVDGGYASVVALRGVGASALPALRQLPAGIDGVQWVDKVGEISSVLGRYREYMSWVVLCSFVAVYGLLYPRYRAAAWRVLAPAALASVATLALLGAAGHGLQLFHVLALMLVLGIGVDYGIFLHERPGRRDETAWLAVGISTLSTLLSFGLLGLSKTPALQAFGLTLLFGITAAWLLVPCFAESEGDSVEDKPAKVA